MASRHRIRCITKSDRQNAHERITHIGGKNENGDNWRLTQEEAIQAIEANKWAFYVLQSGSQEVNVIVASRNGRKYLKTVADGEQPNNLLSLSEC